MNPTNDGMLSWQCESSCMSNLDVGLENWQQRLHEVSGRRLARITKTLRWIRSEVSILPIFHGLFDIKIFVQEYEAQLPYSERLQHLVVALRATPTRWWTAHQQNITTWDTCCRLLLIRFGADAGGMELLYDGVSGPRCSFVSAYQCLGLLSKVCQNKCIHSSLDLSFHASLQVRMCMAGHDTPSYNDSIAPISAPNLINSSL